MGDSDKDKGAQDPIGYQQRLLKFWLLNALNWTPPSGTRLETQTSFLQLGCLELAGCRRPFRPTNNGSKYQNSMQLSKP